ncbi:hypothetical protein HERIO_734 [Hepatospora eriocheir]|uniref:Uncharacterized protein n=1 Tax=Hepatospora eriocheir TaxID=1081669 RepID=A0A1X0QCC6_9MICR|nr:hypothetical protein HERIO_734 [Hepatospora eriocheir]
MEINEEEINKESINEWPIPPIINNKKEPLINKDKIKIFGTDYKIINNRPFIDVETEELDKNKLKTLINKSIDSFKKFITSFNPDEMNKIITIHTEINEIINKAKLVLNDDILINGKVILKNYKKEIIEKIKELINK